MSTYYVTAGNQARMFVLQGAALSSWATLEYHEDPISVSGGYVRTWLASDPGIGGGAEYTLSGTPTGTTYPGGAPSFSRDGTTDGAHNYVVGFDDGVVYRTGLDWSSPQALFGLPTDYDRWFGITYDAADNTLWTSMWFADTIAHWSLTGTLLGALSTGVNGMTSLALDPADRTLWFGTQGDLSEATRTFYQFSRDGSLMDTAQYSGLTNYDCMGGEFAVTARAIPEPTTLGLMGMGLVGLALRRRRRG